MLLVDSVDIKDVKVLFKLLNDVFNELIFVVLVEILFVLFAILVLLILLSASKSVNLLVCKAVNVCKPDIFDSLVVILPFWTVKSLFKLLYEISKLLISDSFVVSLLFIVVKSLTKSVIFDLDIDKTDE